MSRLGRKTQLERMTLGVEDGGGRMDIVLTNLKIKISCTKIVERGGL